MATSTPTGKIGHQKTGRVTKDGRPVFRAGYATAIKKVLDASGVTWLRIAFVLAIRGDRTERNFTYQRKGRPLNQLRTHSLPYYPSIRRPAIYYI